MDNNDGVRDEQIEDGKVIYMFGKEAADQMSLPFEVDDTVNIPRGEYEELIYDSEFLFFLRETVGEETWAAAEAMFEEDLEEYED